MKNIKFNLLLLSFMTCFLWSCQNVKKASANPQGKEEPCIDKSKIDPNKLCTKEYVPVCGCDNVTYGNKCMAMKAGLTSWTQGECKK